TVYLLHAVLIFPLRDSPFLDSVDGPLGTVLVILSGIALTLLLSRDWVCRATRWLTNPPIGAWFFTDPARDQPAETESSSAQQPGSAPAGDAPAAEAGPPPGGQTTTVSLAGEPYPQRGRRHRRPRTRGVFPTAHGPPHSSILAGTTLVLSARGCTSPSRCELRVPRDGV